MNLRQLVVNRHATEWLRGSLAETYAEGGCELHVHFRAGFVQGGEAGDWCAIFNRTVDYLDFVGCEAFDHIENGSSPEKRNVGRTVLVLDGKLVKLPEEVIGEPVTSVIRLQPLDNCFRARVDTPEHFIESSRILLAENRELRTTLDIDRQRLSQVRQGKLEGQIVEGGTKVVDTVTDNQAKFGGGWWLEDFDPKNLLGAINVGFGPRSIWAFFAPDSQFGFKAVQVMKHSA
jgi:hypothetical protein